MARIYAEYEVDQEAETAYPTGRFGYYDGKEIRWFGTREQAIAGALDEGLRVEIVRAIKAYC